MLKRNRQQSRVPLQAIMIAAAIASLSYVLLLAVFSTTTFPVSMVSHSHWPALMDKPVGEDGYYMLTVADNIATRGHILYNGNMPATGIQPLATVLFALLDRAVLAFGGGAGALIRSVMAFGALLFLLLAWQISRIAAALSPAASRRQSAALAFLLTLTSFTLFRLFTYGLETGIYLVLVAACFQVTLRIAARQSTTAEDMVLLGLLAGLAGEARIDFGLLFAVLLVLLLLYRWISPAKAVGAGLLALLIVSPWFVFVHRVSGAWLPTSGKAESTLVTQSTFMERLLTMAVAVGGEVMPWCYGVLSHGAMLAIVLSVGALVWFLAAQKQSRDVLAGLLTSRRCQLWLLCLLSLIPIYLVLFNATHFYYRYVAPLAVLTVPLCAIALAQSSWVRSHMPATAAVLCLAFSGWAAGSLHTGHIGNGQTIAAGYVHQNYPTAHVGSFQSGVMGFFNRNVENLDGKLNQGALEASARHQLPAFIDSQHIDVLVDWPSIVHLNLPATYLQQKWMPCPVPMAGDSGSICLQRRSATEPRL